MFNVNRITLPRAGFSLRVAALSAHPLRKAAVLVAISLLVLVPSNHLRADDLTGMQQDDPKDLIALRPVPQTGDGPCGQQFLPLPSWSHVIDMPPLPYQLKPMGKKPMIAASTPPPAPLTPPKEETTATPASTEAAKPKTASAEPAPALIAVSPFLQWVKANPQAAAAQARQQAETYHASSAPEGGTPGASVPTGPTAPAEDPYWLPPLIDSPTVSASSGGSAAIYSTPQR
jgi:hypothetical protein